MGPFCWSNEEDTPPPASSTQHDRRPKKDKPPVLPFWKANSRLSFWSGPKVDPIEKL